MISFKIDGIKKLGDYDEKYGQRLVKLGKKDVYAIVSEQDYKSVSQRKWYLDDMGYARGNTSRKERTRMHNFIMGKPEKGYVIDHINGNKIDNRRENLRIIPHAANLINSGLWAHNTSGVKGVAWDKERKKWKMYIGRTWKRFNILEEAKEARKKAEEQYYV